MNFSWQHYSAAGMPIDTQKMTQALSLLIQTAKIHSFQLGTPGNPRQPDPSLVSDFVDMVNGTERLGNNGVNWMRVSLGTNVSTQVVDVVIFYHLLKHRLPPAPIGHHQFNGRQWSISVGFNQALTAGQEGGHPDDPANPYVELAISMNDAIIGDIDSPGFDPGATSLCWIDDSEVPTNPATVPTDPNDPVPDPAQYAVELEDQLRAKPIGELGFIARKNNAIKAKWRWSSTLPRIPQHNGSDISGYGRAGHSVCVTEVTRIRHD